MEQFTNYGDTRQMAFCVYCGRGTETRDHVPSKVLLDEPYPTNLPVVPACQKCNESFSTDEEYSACIIDCAVSGAVNSSKQRSKIQHILKRKPALAARLTKAQVQTGKGIIFDIEEERVRNVVLKLGRGHAAFELNEPMREEPSIVTFVPLTAMTLGARMDFETPPRSSILPEVGSRAMQKLVLADPGTAVWIIAQTGRYRYLTSVGNGVLVRMVMSEYLACEVVWA